MAKTPDKKPAAPSSVFSPRPTDPAAFAQQQAGASKAAAADKASADNAKGKSSNPNKIPEIGQQTAKLPSETFNPQGNPASHVTTTRSAGSGSVQSTGGNPNSPSRVQGDTVTATASEVQRIADRNKSDREAEQARVKNPPKGIDARMGKDARYKIASGPSQTFPLIINGMTREMKIGQEYELTANDFEILTEAGFTLDLVD